MLETTSHITERTRLLLADVNGTLLKSGEDRPSLSVMRSSLEAHNQGHLIVPVTSNSIVTLGSLQADLGLRAHGVLDGGATMYDFTAGQRSQELSRWLKTDKLIETVDAIGDLLGRDLAEIYYTEHSEKRTFADMNTSKITAPAPSIFVVYNQAKEDTLYNGLETITGITRHPNAYDEDEGLNCMQIVSQGVDKASGIDIILRSEGYRDIPPENMACIGDGKNDIDMVEAMPEGARCFAMANGDKALKQHPRTEIVPSVMGGKSELDPLLWREGAAFVIDRFLMGRW